MTSEWKKKLTWRRLTSVERKSTKKGKIVIDFDSLAAEKILFIFFFVNPKVIFVVCSSQWNNHANANAKLRLTWQRNHHGKLVDLWLNFLKSIDCLWKLNDERVTSEPTVKKKRSVKCFKSNFPFFSRSFLIEFNEVYNCGNAIALLHSIDSIDFPLESISTLFFCSASLSRALSVNFHHHPWFFSSLFTLKTMNLWFMSMNFIQNVLNMCFHHASDDTETEKQLKSVLGMLWKQTTRRHYFVSCQQRENNGRFQLSKCSFSTSKN